MKVEQEGVRNGHAMGGCRHCKKSVKKGQHFVQYRMPNNPITDRYFVLHVACMAELAADVPPDPDSAREGFEALRSEIISSGRLFPANT